MPLSDESTSKARSKADQLWSGRSQCKAGRLCGGAALITSAVQAMLSADMGAYMWQTERGGVLSVGALGGTHVVMFELPSTRKAISYARRQSEPCKGREKCVWLIIKIGSINPWRCLFFASVSCFATLESVFGTPAEDPWRKPKYPTISVTCLRAKRMKWLETLPPRRLCLMFATSLSSRS